MYSGDFDFSLCATSLIYSLINGYLTLFLSFNKLINPHE